MQLATIRTTLKMGAALGDPPGKRRTKESVAVKSSMAGRTSAPLTTARARPFRDNRRRPGCCPDCRLQFFQ